MHTNEKMKEMPKALRPYEKCERSGVGALSDAELLAVVLKSGTREKSALLLAEEVLRMDASSDGLLSLMDQSLESFRSLKGIGRVKSIQLICLCELSRRIWRASRGRGMQIRDAASAAEYYMQDLRHADQEQVYILLLDTKHLVIGSVLVTQGTVNASVVSPREIFREALLHRAAAFILVHNHPSGDTAPSEEDRRFTALLKAAGQMMNLPLLDSIIIGDNRYYSFAEMKML